MLRVPTTDDGTRWSANGVACLRAAAFLDEHRVPHGDHLAVELVEGWPGFLATTPGLRRLAARAFNFGVPGIYYSHIARTRFFDERVIAALRSGVDQLVLLGAGLDSRAHRLAGDHVRCFEVDLPVNSARKQSRIARTLGQARAHVAYLHGDVTETASLEATLRAAGFDVGKRTVLVLEGVSMYVSADALDRLFAWAATLAPGTVLLFDHFGPDIMTPEKLGRRMRAHVRAMASRGEPYTLGLTSSDVRAAAARATLTADVVLDDEALERAYLRPADEAAAIGTVVRGHGVAELRIPAGA